jgi:hypothetical protein
VLRDRYAVETAVDGSTVLAALRQLLEMEDRREDRRHEGGIRSSRPPAIRPARLLAHDPSVATELGIELEGSKELSHIVNCYFLADIEPHLGDRKGVLFFVSDEHAAGVLQAPDGAARYSWRRGGACSP